MEEKNLGSDLTIDDLKTGILLLKDGFQEIEWPSKEQGQGRFKKLQPEIFCTGIYKNMCKYIAQKY